MSSSQIRRRPRSVALLGAVFVIGLLAGCTGQKDPDGYSDSVRENFVAGCDGSAFVGADDDDAKDAISLPTPQCECIYDTIEETVDFDDFSSANSNRRDDPTPLDDPEFVAAYDACDADGPIEGKTTATTSTETEGTTDTTEG